MAAGDRRRATRVLKESLLGAQTIVVSDVEDHKCDRLYFSFNRPSSFDIEVNVVGKRELRRYRKRYDIPDSINLIPSDERAA